MRGVLGEERFVNPDEALFCFRERLHIGRDCLDESIVAGYSRIVVLLQRQQIRSRIDEL